MATCSLQGLKFPCALPADARDNRKIATSFKIQPELTAVELNQEIINNKNYETTALKENDKVEIVTMMGGG